MNQKKRKSIQKLLAIAYAEDEDDAGGGVLAPPTEIEAYYDTMTMRYFMRAGTGDYIPVTKGDLIEHHLSAGWSRKIPKGDSLSPVTRQILEIQSQNYVDFAGAIAGHAKGFVKFGDTRCLIVSEPTFIEAREGDWSMLRGILERMFGAVQLEHLYGWIKIALDMYRSRTWFAGQMIFFAGPVGAGKNLIVALLRHLFGGRMPGKPYRFMTGRTDFNSDFMGSELLAIEDEVESTAIQARRAFGAAIKSMTVNETQWLHAKGKTAMNIIPYWRIVASLNNEPERLLVVPPVDADLEDKIMLFLVEKHPMPMPTHTAEQRKAFEAALVSQLPAFVHFLQKFTIRPELQESRCGIKHYHHPELLSSLQELSPEKHLMELVDEFIFVPAFAGPWEGESVQLDRALKDCKVGRCSEEAKTLLVARTSCGKYLGRAEKIFPGRISRRTLDGDTIWMIKPPAKHSGAKSPEPKVSRALLDKLQSLPQVRDQRTHEAAS